MQSKKSSFLEAVANTVFGFIFAAILNYALLPFYGMHFTPRQSLTYTAIFTLATALRSYFFRRLFNRRERRAFIGIDFGKEERTAFYETYEPMYTGKFVASAFCEGCGARPYQACTCDVKFP